MAQITLVSSAAVFHVPADCPTIQAAIDSCSTGDTVMVAPGTYSGGGNRNISTDGKAITVTSSGGPLVTIIDADIIESGFDINSGEDSTTVIDGFTIYNSYYGVNCDSSGPVIRNIIIRDVLGYGIHIDGFFADPPAAPMIQNCLIYQERPDYLGTGIGIRATRSVDIVISGCLLENLTYGMEFHTLDNTVPNYLVEKCIIGNNAVDGIWAHS